MSMFDKAKTLNAAPKGAKKSDKREVTLAGLEHVAALDAVVKSLTAVLKTEEAALKERMAAEFIKTGVAQKKKPENFRGIEGDASASCELRKRSEASGLTDEDAKLLADNGIPTQVITSTVDTFVINPIYLADPAIMGAIEAALKKVKGMPEDLFLHQAGSSKTVVTEDSMDVLFAKGDPDLTEDLLPIISTLAIKPKLAEDDMSKAFALVQKLMKPAKKAAA